MMMYNFQLLNAKYFLFYLYCFFFFFSFYLLLFATGYFTIVIEHIFYFFFFLQQRGNIKNKVKLNVYNICIHIISRKFCN